ncbi:MAG: amidohydrolase [Bacteroidota bacterium]
MKTRKKDTELLVSPTNSGKFILLFIISLYTGGCMEKADLALVNGRIYTVDEGFSIKEGLVARDGKIIFTGTTEDIKREFKITETIDLKGKPVYPGFIDAHCHFLGYGLSLAQARLTGTRSFGEVLEILKDHDSKFQPEWLTGRGWDQNDWPEKTFPDKDKLDDLFSDIPVLITRVDGHAALANSKALEIAGITASTRIEGGEILLNNGEPSGILIDNAISLVSEHVPLPGKNEKIKALKEAQKNCLKVGLTSLGDAGLDLEDIQLIDSLQKANELDIRIYAMVNPTTENFEAYVYQGIYKTDRLNVRSIKLFADGALGSRGALLLEPYSDSPDKHGLQIKPAGYYEDMCRKALQHGYQVNTHCIGDSATRLILDIYGSFLGKKNDRRWRIEHAQVIHPDDLHKFSKYSVIPSIQAIHATSDMYWAPARLGKRIKHAYVFQDLLQQNGWIPNGSDFPIENINPLLGFYAAVTRTDLKGYPDGRFQPENSLNREQALRAMTIWAARSFFEENEKGSLETGKHADFVITNEDLMEIEPSFIPRIKILHTFIAGKEVIKP